MKGKPGWSIALCAALGSAGPWKNRTVVMWDGAVVREESLLKVSPPFTKGDRGTQVPP